MTYQLTKIDPSEYPEVVEVWEASVRATHHFLKEEHIVYFKPLILNEYLDAVELRATRDASGRITGFLGVAEGNLEMLFIHPDQRGKGMGKSMLDYAVREMGITKVDVNEQNEQAVGFYHHCGFKTIGRSETDSMGLPYPMLYMELG